MTLPAAPEAPTETAAPEAKGEGVVGLAGVAIAFGVLSLPGLLYIVPGVRESPLFGLALIASNVAPFLAILSWLLALTATGISGVRLLRPPRTRNAKRAFALAAPGAVLGTAAIIGVVIWLASLFGLTQENVAETQGANAVDHYVDQGATLLCDNGDSGYGENRFPWYDAFFDAPASLGTEAQARDALAAAGYPEARRATISDYYDLPDDTRAFVVQSVAANSGDYEGQPLAEVTVVPDGAVSLSCYTADGEWGTDLTPAAGRVIIHVQLVLEATR